MLENDNEKEMTPPPRARASGALSTPARPSSAVIAVLLHARELLGHRIGRELRGTGTLSPELDECKLVTNPT